MRRHVSGWKMLVRVVWKTALQYRRVLNNPSDMSRAAPRLGAYLFSELDLLVVSRDDLFVRSPLGTNLCGACIGIDCHYQIIVIEQSLERLVCGEVLPSDRNIWLPARRIE